MTVNGTLGIILAATSAIFNGSFTSLFKTEKMINLSIDPIIFQLYVAIGVFLSGWVVAPFIMGDVESLINSFSWMGVIAGVLFVFAMSASFIAIDYIGVALAQGIWGGVAMVVSYIWGTFVFHETPSNILVSILALCLLITGVIVIAFCEKLANKMASKTDYEDIESDESKNLMSNNETSKKSAYIYGALWALSVGIFGGSILAPMHYLTPQQQGLSILPSFGIGAFLTAPVLLLLHMRLTNEVPAFHLKDALITGIISGFLFNTGNALSIVAITAIGYGIAYPILQCAILVSGLWGICVFKEITSSPAIKVFFIGGFTLLLGGMLLAVSR